MNSGSVRQMGVRSRPLFRVRARVEKVLGLRVGVRARVRFRFRVFILG